MQVFSKNVKFNFIIWVFCLVRISISTYLGAGTTLEVLRKHKPLLVVINEDLMNNHQIELAEDLAKNNFLFYCTPSSLCQAIEKFDVSKLVTFPDANPSLFASFLHNLVRSKMT